MASSLIAAPVPPPCRLPPRPESLSGAHQSDKRFAPSIQAVVLDTSALGAWTSTVCREPGPELHFRRMVPDLSRLWWF